MCGRMAPRCRLDAGRGKTDRDALNPPGRDRIDRSPGSAAILRRRETEEKKDLEMSGENDARFDVGELADRIRDLRGRFDEFRGRL